MAKTKKKVAQKSTSKGKKSSRVVKSKSPVKASARKTVSAAKTKVSTKAPLIGPVVEYKLFCEDSVRNLEDQVNYYIGKGWAPVGGVVLQGSSNYMQTMIRHQP